jgi:hypothetical protein
LYNGNCSSNCPDGFYTNVDTLICTACNSTCLTCTSSSYCTKCVTGYCFSLGNCINSSVGCISTYYPLIVNNLCYCTGCSYPCLACNSQSICTSCISGYLYNNGCTTYCLSGYYGNDTIM